MLVRKSLIPLLLLFGLFFNLELWAGTAWAASAREVNFNPTVEATGEIRSGDTVKARDEALHAVLVGALRQVIAALVPSNTLAKFNDMVEENLVANVGRFVKNYLIAGESSEKNSYWVRARVQLDSNLLLEELRYHGLLPLSGQPPRLLFWMRETPAGFAVHDGLVDRLEGLPLRIVARAKLPQLATQSPYREPYEKLQSGNSIDVQELLKLADLTQTQYVLYGTASGTASNQTADKIGRCAFNVVRVSSRQELGRIDCAPGGSGQNALAYLISGTVLSDWYKLIQADQRIELQIGGITSAGLYRAVLQSLRKLPDVKSLEEYRVGAQWLQVKIECARQVSDLVAALQTASIIADPKTYRLRVDIKDARHLEGTLE